MKNGLQQLAAYLARLGFMPTYRGDPYGQGLDWVYFDCYFDEAAVRRHFGLGAETHYVAYDGRAAGQEGGFMTRAPVLASWAITPTMAGRAARRRLPAPSKRYARPAYLSGSIRRVRLIQWRQLCSPS